RVTPAGVEVNLLLHPVRLWRLANQNPILGKPVSVKHGPDVRQHQRLGTTVPRLARAARTGHLFPGVIVGTSEHSQTVIVMTEHASLVAVRLFAEPESIHRPWLSPRKKSVKSTKSSGTS